MTRLPLAARVLLRLSPLAPETRAEAEGDLQELFEQRRRERGTAHAHWRLYGDVLSLSHWSALMVLHGVRMDLRYAARMFARQPGILALTIAGLSLGLGIATSAFSIMNAAVLRGEGVVEPDRAPGVLRTADRATWTVWSYDEFLHLRAGATRMEIEAVLSDAAVVKTASGDADGPSAGLAFVSGRFFAATGGRVALGRPLEAGDEERTGPPPVVISHVFWSSRLDRDPAAVGRTIRVGRVEATIVGVAARGFSVPGNRLLWLPLTAYGAVYGGGPGARAPQAGLNVFGRLRPGVSLSEAEAQLAGVAATLPRTTTDAAAPVGVRLDPAAGLGRMAASDVLGISLFVFSIIGLILLLACANVATVLISTAIAREREMGVRAALGASRARIVRQLVTESLAMAAIAAAFGLLFASWALPTIGTMIDAPAGADLAPDLTVFLFLAIVTLVTGVAAGLAPARHGRGVDLVTPLKGEGARLHRVAPRRLRALLVTTQAAASVLLIVLAALFVRASFRAAATDVGFEPKGLYAVSASLNGPDRDGARTRAFWARAIADLQTALGVATATLAEITPFDGTTKTSASGGGPTRVVTYLNRTRGDYFDAMGLRLAAGRSFSREEVASKAPVVVVSQSFARAYWGDRSPIDQPLPPQVKFPELTPSPVPRIVIGVVEDAITADLHRRNALAVYEPLDPASEIFARLVVREVPGTTGGIQQAMQRLRAIDPQADVRVASVEAQLRQEANQPRMLATLTGFVGVIAIVLCGIGLYGLTASVVGQRTREMAVRAAIGAERRDLLRLMLRDSLRPVLVGLAIGTAAAVLAGRALAAAIFFGVSPQDPLALGGAAAVLVAAATLAVLVPTRRAAAVDPAFVLRQS